MQWWCPRGYVGQEFTSVQLRSRWGWYVVALLSSSGVGTQVDWEGWDVELSRIVMNAIVVHKTLWEGRVPWYITCFDMSERILCALERTKSKQKPAHKLRLSTLLRNRLHIKLQTWADVEPQVPVPTKNEADGCRWQIGCNPYISKRSHIGNNVLCSNYKLRSSFPFQ